MSDACGSAVEGSSVEKTPHTNGKSKVRGELPAKDSSTPVPPVDENVYLDLVKVAKEYKSDGRKVVNMRIVKTPGDLADTVAAGEFHPLFVYQYLREPLDKSEQPALQLNGANNRGVDVEMNGDESDEDSEASEDDDGMDDDEVYPFQAPALANGPDEFEGLIVGYQDLNLKVLFTPATLKAFVQVRFTSALPLPERSVPDLLQAIEKVYGHKVMTTSDAMDRAVQLDQQFIPIGDKVAEFTVVDKSNENYDFELFEVGDQSQEFGYPPRFQEYLAELQPVLMWFIYAANVIATDDPNWLHFTLYEKTSASGFCLVGYCSVYRYNVLQRRSKPAEKWTGEISQRCRISQFIILPPYQKLGYGARMLRKILERLQQTPKTYEITVEDPTPDFTRLFDCVATSMIKDYFASKKIVVDYKKPLDADLYANLHKNLKFSPRITLFCYDVIANSMARLEGQDSAKQYNEKFRLRVQKKLEANTGAVRRTVQRLKLGYYRMNELEEKEQKRLSALWHVNAQSQLEEQARNLEPVALNRAVQLLTDRAQYVAKRMDQIQF